MGRRKKSWKNKKKKKRFGIFKKHLKKHLVWFRRQRSSAGSDSPPLRREERLPGYFQSRVGGNFLLGFSVFIVLFRFPHSRRGISSQRQKERGWGAKGGEIEREKERNKDRGREKKREREAKTKRETAISGFLIVLEMKTGQIQCLRFITKLIGAKTIHCQDILGWSLAK